MGNDREIRDDRGIFIAMEGPDGSGKSTQIAAASAVSLSNVMAVLFDEDALMVDYQLDSALSSPIEARKRYYTVWNSISAGYLADYTENCIVFTMEDPTT